MIILRMRNESEHEELLRKLKKMHKFTKDLLEKVEECCEMEEDYDEDYREDEGRGPECGTALCEGRGLCEEAFAVTSA